MLDGIAGIGDGVTRVFKPGIDVVGPIVVLRIGADSSYYCDNASILKTGKLFQGSLNRNKIIRLPYKCFSSSLSLLLFYCYFRLEIISHLQNHLKQGLRESRLQENVLGFEVAQILTAFFQPCFHQFAQKPRQP